jgi:hypothetical protein
MSGQNGDAQSIANMCVYVSLLGRYIAIAQRGHRPMLHGEIAFNVDMRNVTYSICLVMFSKAYFLPFSTCICRQKWARDQSIPPRDTLIYKQFK